VAGAGAAAGAVTGFVARFVAGAAAGVVALSVLSLTSPRLTGRLTTVRDGVAFFTREGPPGLWTARATGP
ncbi:hypothetical protein C0036_16400, partial [Streptomyces sp. DJ]